MICFKFLQVQFCKLLQNCTQSWHRFSPMACNFPALIAELLARKIHLYGEKSSTISSSSCCCCCCRLNLTYGQQTPISAGSITNQRKEQPKKNTKKCERIGKPYIRRHHRLVGVQDSREDPLTLIDHLLAFVRIKRRVNGNCYQQPSAGAEKRANFSPARAGLIISAILKFHQSRVWVSHRNSEFRKVAVHTNKSSLILNVCSSSCKLTPTERKKISIWYPRNGREHFTLSFVLKSFIHANNIWRV